MKTVKAIGAALVLALSLSIPAYADPDPGDAHTPGRSTSSPSEPVAQPGSSVDADPMLPTIVDILWALASMY